MHAITSNSRAFSVPRAHFSSAQMDIARSPKRRWLTDYFTKLPSTAEPQHFPACLRWYDPVNITRRPSHPVERPKHCTEITSKQASGSGEQASGSGGQASESEESGNPKPTPGSSS